MNTSEKIKLIRKANNLTQAEFANSIGISRGNLANIERGNVVATPIFINCVSLLYNIDKNWLIDDTNDDLSFLNSSVNMQTLITEKYEQLDDKYKKFVENQINQLLDIQNTKDKINSED
jgi:transcriptional regulator with XRE-family HTH domain